MLKEMILNFETMTEQQILAIADPIMDNLMEASTQRDHTPHIRDFTERLKGIVTPDYFACICQHYQEEKGYFTTRTPIAVLRRPDSAAILWKQHFTKASGEFAAEMVLVHRDGRYLVDHVMVF